MKILWTIKTYNLLVQLTALCSISPLSTKTPFTAEVGNLSTSYENATYCDVSMKFIN